MSFIKKWTSPDDLDRTAGLRYWRERFLLTLLLAATVFGPFALVPSVALSIREDLWGVAVLDVAIYGWVVHLFANRSSPFALKMLTISGMTYGLGLVLLMILGPFGGGPVWLFAFPIVVALFMGPKASLVAWGINALTVVAVGILLSMGFFGWGFHTVNPVEKWIVSSLNFLLLSGLSAAAVSMATRGLQALLEEKEEVLGNLERQRLDLLFSQERLLEEVAERKRTEEQLSHAQRMESIGRLSGGIAHDFNNLLMVISNYAAMTMDDLPEDSDLREGLEEILGASRRATQLTRQLLAFSRKQVLAPAALNLNEVIKSVEGMLRRLIGEDVELCMDLSGDLRTVVADSGSVEQILMNLVVNARDAMPDGGTVTISTANVDLVEGDVLELPGTTPGPQVMLTVSDTGSGMTPEVRERVFEPFFTTKDVGRGTGLGLSTVYGIVRQSGGIISIESEVGRGTRFEILLPEVCADIEPLQRVDSKASQLGGHEKILVVEDEPSVRGLTQRILSSVGYRVVTAEDPIVALELLDETGGSIDLLLTDVVMPKMSGLDLARATKERVPGLQVLLMSGYSDQVLDRKAIVDQGHPILEKPVERNALLAAVREALGKTTSGDGE